MSHIIGKLFRFAKLTLRRDVDLAFLPQVKGVIHVGGNIGQARRLYDDYGLAVAWIEPIPDVFQILQRNIRPYRRQRAFQHLVADTDGVAHQFHIANNGGASSSILDLALHREIWPDVRFVRTMTLQGITLKTLAEQESLDLNAYDALVLDTQGSELLVLRGAEPILRRFSFIKVEAADFDVYSGCSKIADIESFLEQSGFSEVARRRFAQHPAGGGCYDLVYQRRS